MPKTISLEQLGYYPGLELQKRKLTFEHLLIGTCTKLQKLAVLHCQVIIHLNHNDDPCSFLKIGDNKQDWTPYVHKKQAVK